MQKNFVQRHALFFSVIVFCFVIVPFIRNAYAQEKADKKQQAETLLIRTQKQAEEKKVTKRRVVLDVTAAMMTAVLRRMAQRKKTLHCS